MSEASTRIFCPFCRTEIQLTTEENASKGITASTILKGVGVAIAVPCAAATLAGFGAGGIVASSAATVWQASIGNVAAGSVFATLQSMGATGTFYSGMAYGGTSFFAGKWWESRNTSRSQQQEEANDRENDEKGGKGGAGKDGKGENKNSSDSTENDSNEDDDGQVSLTCPSCGRSFTISMPTSATAATDNEVERIAQ